jgi:hypothetical protein
LARDDRSCPSALFSILISPRLVFRRLQALLSTELGFSKLAGDPFSQLSVCQWSRISPHWIAHTSWGLHTRCGRQTATIAFPTENYELVSKPMEGNHRATGRAGYADDAQFLAAMSRQAKSGENAPAADPGGRRRRRSADTAMADGDLIAGRRKAPSSPAFLAAVPAG